MKAATGTEVRAVLARLDELAGDADRDELAALRDRLESARLRVLVAGEAKRGKSTLVNALLGREVLPSGVIPLTAVPATVVQATGSDEGIEVAFTDGRSARYPLPALPDFGTERGNPGNSRHVAAITVLADAPILARGVEIVDTPGTGSVHAHNTAAADAALPSMDAAIFVLTADPPVSASERDLLRRVAGMSVALFIVLNKADYLDQIALAEAEEFTARIVAEVTGRPAPVYPLSARSALGKAGDAGFTAFETDFTAYLDSGRVAGLEVSVTRHASRIAQQLLDEVALAQRAARLPGDEAAGQIAAFRARLDAVSGRRADAGDRAAAQSGRLLEALNTAAEQAVPLLTTQLGARMAELLDGELATAATADIERLGRSRLASMVAQAAEAWRQEQASLLELGLRAIDDRLAAELDAELAAVRAAAADLLGVGLALPSPGDRLPAALGFFYTLDEHVDQAELLAGAVRRRMPGEYGRRLARQRLLGQVCDLVGSQVGRARADLQYRLAEATRKLLADLARRYAVTTQRLDAALDRAAAIRAEAGTQGERELADLDDRERALRALLAQVPARESGPVAASTAAGRAGERS
ncbi:MAG TPA: dynamin family protein [Streptosporangiaceae bacterium]|nr:dynamin family protein [Streptosporangiaceae bacterium]